MNRDDAIPNDFLEMCIDTEERTLLDEDQITEYLVSDMPDVGETVNATIYGAVKAIVKTHIMPKAEEFFENYFEPSAREEALNDIERETIETLRSRE